MTPGELAKHYSSMLDGELLKLARKPSDLFPEAQQALTAELRKRGLNPPEPESDDPPPLPPVPVEYAEAEIDPDEQVIIRRFRDFPEAMIANSVLESVGIERFLADENMIRMNWLLSNLFGGLKLKVRHEDVGVALEVLEQPIPPSFDIDGIGGYEQPSCPKCSSLEIAFEEFDKRWWGVAVFVNFPLLIPRNRWYCWACGHSWKDLQEAELQQQ